VSWLAAALLLATLVTELAAGQSTRVTGSVFVDGNNNGRRDSGEPGVPRVAVSNQMDVVATDAAGNYSLPSRGTGVVFVSVPEGFRAAGTFWQRVDSGPVVFALVPVAAPAELTFIHASDPHIQPSAVARMDRLRAITDSVKPGFVLITGDLTRDALRVGEAEARGYYELYARETARITAPVWSVPGNHELFGIERHLSLVSPSHPLYGRGMYREYLGPDYYSFNAGGVHFVGLNTADHEDLWYFGHVDSTQLRWLERDVAQVPTEVPIVTFNHIPFASAKMTLDGFEEEPPAPTVIRVRGKNQYRHVVSNLDEVLKVIGDRPFPLALGGHLHTRERLEFGTQRRSTRFEQTAAVVGPAGPSWLPMASGVTVYRVRAGIVSEGVFVHLDPSRR
jgi:3',5'-cyclic AMP phosphodiesterase CpdA